MADNKRKAAPAFDIRDLFSKENLPLISLIVLGIFAVVSLIVTIAVFHINPIIACVMVILEAALAACLNQIPIWIHGRKESSFILDFNSYHISTNWYFLCHTSIT